MSVASVAVVAVVVTVLTVVVANVVVVAIVAMVNTVAVVVAVSAVNTAAVAVEVTTVDPAKMRTASWLRPARSPSPVAEIIEATVVTAEIIEADAESAAASAETGRENAEVAVVADQRLATTRAPPKNNSPQLSELELRLHDEQGEV